MQMAYAAATSYTMSLHKARCSAGETSHHPDFNYSICDCNIRFLRRELAMDGGDSQM